MRRIERLGLKSSLRANSPVLVKASSCFVGLFLLVSALPRNACADDLAYAMTTTNQLGTIDLQTGAFTPLGTITGITQGTSIGDIARFPEGLLYGIWAAGVKLVVIDPVSFTGGVIGVPGNYISAIAFRPDGALFGVSTTNASIYPNPATNYLYRIDPRTGAAARVAALAGPGFPGIGGYTSIKFDNAGHLYLLNHNVLYTVDTSSGQTTLVGSTGFSVYELGFANGTLYGFTTGSKIIRIDGTTGAGVVVATETSPKPIDVSCAGGVSAGGPPLTIQTAKSNSFVLSWIAPSNDFRLQENQTLATTNWMTVSNSLSVTNSLNQVTVSPSVPVHFFRLIQP